MISADVKADAKQQQIKAGSYILQFQSTVKTWMAV